MFNGKFKAGDDEGVRRFIDIFAVVKSTSAERLQIHIHAAHNPLSVKDVAYLEA